MNDNSFSIMFPKIIYLILKLDYQSRIELFMGFVMGLVILSFIWSNYSSSFKKKKQNPMGINNILIYLQKIKCHL